MIGTCAAKLEVGRDGGEKLVQHFARGILDITAGHASPISRK
jgi:hypothetical protein